MKCWQWVRTAYPDLLIFHVANERKTNVQHHVKLKRMGVLPGVADFLVFPGKQKFAIELKDAKGVQSVDQVSFELLWTRAGGRYFLVRTLEEFQIVVNGAALFG